MLKKFDLISIGDSTHDTFIQLEEASIQHSVDNRKRLLCLPWADKIPAKKVTQVPGVGNSSNAAVGSARLGLKTAIYTHIGTDIIGKSIKKVFKEAGVVTNFVKTEKGVSNYSVVLNFGAERTIIVHHKKWNYNLPKNINAKWFYYSSLGPSHQILHKQIIQTVKKHNIKVMAL